MTDDLLPIIAGLAMISVLGLGRSVVIVLVMITAILLVAIGVAGL